MKQIDQFPYWRQNVAVSVANKVAQRLLGRGPRTACFSAVTQISAVKHDPYAGCLLTPALLDIATKAITCAQKINLESLDPVLGDEMNRWPGEHYRILAALVQVLRPNRIIDIGTATGLSALTFSRALRGQGEVVTFDVIPWTRFKKTFLKPSDMVAPQLRQEVADLSDPEVFEAYLETLCGANLIFVDGPKNGCFEQKLLDNFQRFRLTEGTMVIFDDIRLWKMMNIWEAIRQPRLDLTSFGHYTGTGLIQWTNEVHLAPPLLATRGEPALDQAVEFSLAGCGDSALPVNSRHETAATKQSLENGGAPATGPTVWVLIAVFNRIHYTRKCLELLRSQTYSNLRPVVVDDGSSDGTSAMIRTEHPDVVLLRGDGSLYWTGAMHLGMAHIMAQSAANDYVLLLNDDLVFGLDLVEKLLEKSRLHPRSLIQAVESCVDEPDLIWQGGVQMNWWTAKHCLLNYHRRISDFPSGYFEKSDYLTARGVLAAMEVFRVIGNYDPSYKQNGDPEFTRRAAKNGYDLIVSYDVPVLSYEKGKNLNEAESFSLSDLKQFYFGVLSSFCLSTRWKQATSMTNSGVQALIFFGLDFVRITGHFVKRLKVVGLKDIIDGEPSRLRQD